MSYKILLTSAGGRLSPEMIKLFKNSDRHKITVIAVDCDREASAKFFADYFEIVPRGTDVGFADVILSICMKYEVNLVIPCSDEEVISLSEKQQKFSKQGIVLAVPPEDILEYLIDKSKTYKLLNKKGLPTPTWKIVEKKEEILDKVKGFLNQFGECVVKPTKGRGGRGVYIISNNTPEFSHLNDARDIIIDFNVFCSEYLNKVQENLPIIVMERLMGPGYDVDVLSIDGKVKRMVPRRRFISSGTPFKGSLICWPEEVINLANKVAKSFKLSWLTDLDLMTDRNGNLQFTEINPRPSGGVVSSIAAGIPILDDFISIAKKEDIPNLNKKNIVAVVPYTSTMCIPKELTPEGK